MSITHNCTRVSREINTHRGDASVWVRILCALLEGLERESLPVCQIRQVYLKGFSRGQEARLFPEPTFSQSPTSLGTGCPLASSGEFGLDTHAGFLWACLLSFWAGLTPSMNLFLRFTLLWGPLALLGSHNWCTTTDLDSLVGSGHIPYAVLSCSILSLGSSLTYMLPY